MHHYPRKRGTTGNVCDAIDWAEDNEPGFVVQKFRILDTKQPTPEWCPLEENK